MPRFTNDVFTASQTALADPKGTFDEYLADGHLLVPICRLVVAPTGLNNGHLRTTGACDNPLPPGEAWPVSLAGADLSAPGWVYFRREVDDGARYFLSPDGLTWLKQEKSGLVTQFGHPLDAGTVDAALADGSELAMPSDRLDKFNFASPLPAGTTPIYRWNIVRQTDASGNTVYYTWTSNASLAPTGSQLPDIKYLSDIYDTLAVGQAPAPSAFAHHVHLTWQLSFPFQNVVHIPGPIWRAVPFARLATVDVTSASFSSTQRSLVRRYSLGYNLNSFGTRTYLTTIGLEGECQNSSGGLSPAAEGFDGTVSNPTSCSVACTSSSASNSCNTMQVAGYSYSVDALAGDPHVPAVQKAFDLSSDGRIAGPIGRANERDIGFPAFASSHTFVDLTGDGAAELVFSDAIFGGGSDLYEGSFLGQVTKSSFPAGVVWPCRIFPRIAGPSPLFGDWLANGTLSWLSSAGGGWGVYSATSHAAISPGSCGSTCLPDRALDVDGNGLTDLSLIPGLGTINFPTYLSQRTHGGTITPFAMSTPAPNIWNNNVMAPNTWRSVTDMDGDGVADVVIGTVDGNGGAQMQTWLARGDGAYGYPDPGALPYIGVSPVTSTATLPAGLGNSIVQMADVNADGFADIVQLTSSSLAVCLRYGAPLSQARWSCSATALPGITSVTSPNPACGGPLDPAWSTLDFADVDGSGVPRIFVSRFINATCHDTAIWGTAVAPGISPSLGAPSSAPRPGLLSNIWLLGGGQTSLTYQAVRTLNVDNADLCANAGGHCTIPVSAWVVTGITTTNGMNAGGFASQGRTTTTNYTYQVPLYDGLDRTFLGFEQVIETHQPTDNGAASLRRTTTFAPTYQQPTLISDGCLLGVCNGPQRMLRGLPVAVEESDATTGTRLRTTVNEYYLHRVAVGIDGRPVNRLPLYTRIVYLWDPANRSATTRDLSFVFDPSREPPFVSVSLPMLSSDLVQQRVEDDLGNELSTVDFGLNGTDMPIRTEKHWSLPDGDLTGWNYRLDTKTTGYAAGLDGATLGTPERTYHYKYDSLGRPTITTATLSGEPPVMGLAQNFVAKAPPDASVNGTVCLAGCYPADSPAGIQYDSYGNPTLVPGPSHRCSRTNYDPLFQELPTSLTNWVNGCESSGGLTETVQYDAGFQEVTFKTAPQTPGQLSRITVTSYDPFGRVVEVDQPSASVPGMTAATAALKVQYFDGGVVRQVVSQTVDGPESDPTYQSHYRFIDGFGDALFTLDQATTPTGALQWIVTGAHRRYHNGLVASTYQPFFSDVGDATTYAPDTDLATHPASTAAYDAIGRTVSKTDYNGNTTTSSYQFGIPGFATVVTTLDPEQGPSGAHPGSYLRVQSDGHGRVTQKIAHIANGSQGAGDVVTTTTYSAMGERTTIGQTYPPGGTYSRQMSYDTLGRMVSQTEPNAGTWSYAYNDAGQLVGVMDPRACGKVIYRDWLGRVMAEDYSPCSPSQPAYSPPNLATGDGTEASYGYDGYGQLYVLSDRAQISTFNHDWRGRVTEFYRRIASPNAGPDFSTRYTERTYLQQSLEYSEANRLLTSSTGAHLPDFLVSNSSTVTTGYTLQGTISSVTSSYGPLLTSQTTDAAGRVTAQTYGDAAPTTGAMGYDNNGALVGYVLQRTPATNGQWTTYARNASTAAGQNTFQSVLASESIAYDNVGNPTSITQSETATTASNGLPLPAVAPSEWPSGAKPVWWQYQAYWDDYRLRESFLVYTPVAGSGYDTQASPYLPTENYPQLNTPQGGMRVTDELYSYDGRGNITSSSDATNDFYDRSLGTVTVGSPLGPDQLVQAQSTDGQSSLSTTYDSAGQLTEYSVQTPSSTAYYDYQWDEVGHLLEAQRSSLVNDPSLPGPLLKVVAQETYSYDAQGHRVSIAKTDTATGNTTYTINIFDSLVLEHASFVGTDSTADYQDDDTTTHVYLGAGGLRLGHAFIDSSQTLPSATGSNLHIFMRLPDPLQSTAFVIDRDTSELVEAATYQAYGAVNSDYRPTRWNSFREDYRYTGEWDHAEVGLVYLNSRYYAPNLGRFISPDPHTIQDIAGDINPYEYAFGAPMRYVDRSGLEPSDSNFTPTNCNQNQLFTPYAPAPAWSPVPAPSPSASASATPMTYYPDGGAPEDRRYDQQNGALYPGDQYLGPTIDTRPTDDRFIEYANYAAIFLPGGAEKKALAEGFELALIAERTAWGRAQTLLDHFGRHGADFAATTAEDYAAQASRFFQDSKTARLPTKIDSDGVIRVYDPETNTFGSYNSDGTTKTFFKPDPAEHGYPTNEDYWNAQDGESQ